MKDFYEALAGLISIESVAVDGSADTPFGEGSAKALDYMLALCGEMGFRTKKCANMLGWAEIGEGDEMVGILVHLDVVPAGGGWDYPPFALTRTVVDGEPRLYGRGICDDKGPAMMCVYAMKRILDSGIKTKRRVRIIFGLSEERGDWDDMKYYTETEELPTYGITPDATFPAVYGEKGILVLELSMPKSAAGIDSVSGGSAHNVVPDSCTCTVSGKSVTASGKSAHGSTPTKGTNAILACMKQISCPLADFINSCFDERCDGQALGCALSDRESGSLTLNVGVVETRGDDVVVTIDIRYPVTFTDDKVTELAAAGCAPYGVSVAKVGNKNPIYTDRDGLLITSLSKIYRDFTGDTSEPIVMGGGTYARAMPNIVAFGPMFPDSPETEHQKNEYMRESDMDKARRIYDAAVEKMMQL